jgi:hypothetical protein
MSLEEMSLEGILHSQANSEVHKINLAKRGQPSFAGYDLTLGPNQINPVPLGTIWPWGQIKEGWRVEDLLYEAAIRGYYDYMKFLIKNGCSVNAENSYGRPPLHLAIRFRNYKCIKLLVRYGADIDSIIENGWTPLHMAVANNLKKSVILLLTKGKAINTRDTDGRTPLHIAIMDEDAQKVKLLLRHGGNPYMGSLIWLQGQIVPSEAGLTLETNRDMRRSLVEKAKVNFLFFHLLYICRNCQIREARYDLALGPNQSASLYNNLYINLFINLYDKAVLRHVRKYM